MEFSSRRKCIEYYSEHYPNLPRYMIEMALDYDLSTSKPKTGREKRKQKRDAQAGQCKAIERGQWLQQKLENAEQLELDVGKVIPAVEYVMPPFVKGHIECDGMEVAAQIEDWEEVKKDPE